MKKQQTSKKQSSAAKQAPKRTTQAAGGSSRRTVFVFTTLVGALSVTSALLLALAPAPMMPSASSSLFAVDAPDSMDAVFNTRNRIQDSRWKYIYVHHSRTVGGNATTLAQSQGSLGDHFVIGNGDGAVDGEIQVGHRWNQQTTAAPPKGAQSIDPTCISVCLVGDFDNTTPTPTQLRRLGQLTSRLQARFHIPADNILMVDQQTSSAGIGRFFPTTAFKQQILR